MMHETDWQAERGFAEARNLYFTVAEHLLTVGGTLKDFAIALNAEMTVNEVRRVWPVRRAAAPGDAQPGVKPSFDAPVPAAHLDAFAARGLKLTR